MGKGRDKRKKAKGSSTAGHGAAKTEKKTQLNEEKKNRRGAHENAGEDDIYAILAELDKEKGAAARGPVVTADADPPGPRICCVWQPNGDQV
jgi:hypothetical protein